MDSKKKNKLAEAGWKSGSAEEFLGLSHAESVLVKLRLRLSDNEKNPVATASGSDQTTEVTLAR